MTEEKRRKFFTFQVTRCYTAVVKRLNREIVPVLNNLNLLTKENILAYICALGDPEKEKWFLGYLKKSSAHTEELEVLLSNLEKQMIKCFPYHELDEAYLTIREDKVCVYEEKIKEDSYTHTIQCRSYYLPVPLNCSVNI